jgi:predicted DNA-binding transcriptional regulator YafY
MRADRLLSLLMLLQTQGRMTAQELAEELEVSERTIYRDIDVLSFAGVPVYAVRGPGGGCDLLDSYRVSLTGLNEEEVQALFMLSIPAPLAQLGVSQKLKTALLKLTTALSSASHRQEQWVNQRIHVDVVPWFQPEESVPHLGTVHQAVCQDRRLQLTYQLPFEASASWLVDPYGLVTKAGVWYLICAREGKIRVYRVAKVIAAMLSEDHFDRPEDFDITAFWNTWCIEAEQSRPQYPVKVRATPELLPHLQRHFGDSVRELDRQVGSQDEEWITLTLPFETFFAARNRILGYGRAIKVLDPEALRLSIMDFASQITALYSD